MYLTAQWHQVVFSSNVNTVVYVEICAYLNKKHLLFKQPKLGMPVSYFSRKTLSTFHTFRIYNCYLK